MLMKLIRLWSLLLLILVLTGAVCFPVNADDTVSESESTVADEIDIENESVDESAPEPDNADESEYESEDADESEYKSEDADESEYESESVDELDRKTDNADDTYSVTTIATDSEEAQDTTVDSTNPKEVLNEEAYNLKIPSVKYEEAEGEPESADISEGDAEYYAEMEATSIVVDEAGNINTLTVDSEKTDIIVENSFEVDNLVVESKGVLVIEDEQNTSFDEIYEQEDQNIDNAELLCSMEADDEMSHTQAMPETELSGNVVNITEETISNNCDLIALEIKEAEAISENLDVRFPDNIYNGDNDTPMQEMPDINDISAKSDEVLMKETTVSIVPVSIKKTENNVQSTTDDPAPRLLVANSIDPETQAWVDGLAEEYAQVYLIEKDDSKKTKVREKNNVSWIILGESTPAGTVTANINNCLNTALSNNTEKKILVRVGNGIFNINGLSIYSNTDLQLANNATLKRNNTAWMLTANGKAQNPLENITVSGGLWDGGESNPTSASGVFSKTNNGIMRFFYSSNIKVSETIFQNASAEQMLSLQGANTAVVENVTFKNNYVYRPQNSAGNLPASSQAAVYVGNSSDGTSCEDILIQNNSFNGLQTDAMHINDASDVEIIDNTAVQINQFAVLNDSKMIASGNVITGAVQGVIVDGGIAGLSDENYSLKNKTGWLVKASEADVTIDNSVFNNGKGIYAHDSIIRISDNKLNGAGGPAIYLDHSTGAIVRNNELTGVGISQSNYGIYVNGSNNSNIISNILRNSFMGIYVGSAPVTLQNNLIYGSLGSGIRVKDAPNTVIKSNTLNDCAIQKNTYAICISTSQNSSVVSNTLNHPYYGIYITGAAAAVNNNSITSAEKAGIRLLNAGNAAVRNNVLSNSGTKTKDFAIALLNSGSVNAYQNIVNNAYRGFLVKNTPAVIEGNRVSASTGYAMRIHNADNAIVKNNTITNSAIGGKTYALHVTDSDNIQIINNKLTKAYHGLYVNSVPAVVSGNVMSNTYGTGMRFKNADNSNVTGNSFTNSGMNLKHYAIVGVLLDNCVFLDNMILRSYNGLNLNNSESNTVSGNRIYRMKGTYNLVLNNKSVNNTVSGNTFGVTTRVYKDSTSPKNTVSGNKNYYGNWQKDKNGYKYYFDNDTYAAPGFTKISASNYYFDADQYRVEGWQTISGKDYFFKVGSGVARTGWYTVNGPDIFLYPHRAGNKYYFDKTNGAMLKGKQTIDSKVYWFDSTTGVLEGKTAGIKLTTIPDGVHNVMSFGANAGDGKDDTEAFNDAIFEAATSEEGFRTVYVPAGSYTIDPEVGIKLRNNVNLIMDPAAILNIIPTSKDDYTVMDLVGVNNVAVFGGQIKGERAKHTKTNEEVAVNVEIKNSKNITLSYMNIASSWGDGIYLGASNYNTGYGCDSIVIKGCTVTNSRRSNISVVDGVRNLTIDGCTISNAKGRAPQCGINVEPNYDSATKKIPEASVCKNLKIYSTVINTLGKGDKYGQFFTFMTIHNPADSTYKSADNLLIRNCTFNGDAGNYSGLRAKIINTIIKGTFYDRRNTTLSNVKYEAIWAG